jgi:hypothetical protein
VLASEFKHWVPLLLRLKELKQRHEKADITSFLGSTNKKTKTPHRIMKKRAATKKNTDLVSSPELYQTVALRCMAYEETEAGH